MATANTGKLHPKLSKFIAACTSRHKGLDMEDILAIPSFRMECINTGSTVMNLLIGGSLLKDGSFVCPGWPRSRIVEIFGRESSGKSTIALMAMGQAISAGGVGLYVDLEHAVVDAYAIKLGVDFRSPETGGPGNAVRVVPHTFQEVEAIVNEAAQAGVDLIVVDSVAGLVSNREASRDITDDKQKQGVAEIPRLMSQWMPKLQDIISKSKTCVIFVNQTRDKIGAMGYTEEAKKSTTGGNALKFWAALRLMLSPKMSAKAKVWNPVLKEYEEVPVATDVQVKNIKNKIDARQGHSGLITIRYGVGIDEIRTMLNVAEAYKIVKTSKNKMKQVVYRYESPGTGEVIEVIGVEKLRSALQKTPGVLDEFMGLCRDRIVQGLRSISDEELAQLAEDAITKSIGDDGDDEYEDSGPPAVVAPSDMGMDDETGAAGVSAVSLED